MPSNADANPAREVAVDETITLDDAPPNKEGMPDIAPEKPRRQRRSVGDGIATLRERIAAGEATPEEIEKVRARDERRKRAPVDSPPEAEKKAREIPRGGWQERYCSIDGRELICVKLGEMWHAGLCALESYIVESGGKPFISPSAERTDDDTTHWRGILVVAVDEILPPNVKATPAILASVGTTSLATQAAVAAYKKRNKTKPTPPQKTETVQPETEAERVAKAKDVNPEVRPTGKAAKRAAGIMTDD